MTDKKVESGFNKAFGIKKEEVNKEEELMTKMAEIEKEYGGFGSIPVNHPSYWDLRKELQRLQNK